MHIFTFEFFDVCILDVEEGSYKICIYKIHIKCGGWLSCCMCVGWALYVYGFSFG